MVTNVRRAQPPFLCFSGIWTAKFSKILQTLVFLDALLPGALEGPPAPPAIAGSIEMMTVTMTFNEAHPELVKGMAVTAPGLDNDPGGSPPGLCCDPEHRQR